jgi:cell volume regulation protein A
MALFLTVGCLQLLTHPGQPAVTLLPLLVRQMALGGVLGYGLGRATLFMVNRLRLGFDGLYPVLTSTMVLLTYGLTTSLGGSGFLAVYVAGIVVAHHPFIHRRSLLSFHDGLAWLMQIVLFLTLGLLVFPSRLPGVAVSGLLLSAFLIVVARPVSVLATLLPFRLSMREKLLVSWVGLRGAVPIVLATFPLLAGVPNAGLYFDLVFFVVLVSALLQGTTIPRVARWLGVDAPLAPRRELPLEYVPVKGLKSELRELVVPPESPAVGRAVVSLGLPAGFLIIMIGRGDEYIVSSGSTVLQGHDRLLVLAEAEQLYHVVPRWGWLEPQGWLVEVRE